MLIMANLEVYRFLGLSSLSEFCDSFFNTLINTNRSYNFFVDWQKIEENIAKYKLEIGLLSALTGSPNLEHDFKNLIKKYPEVIKVLPLLIAVRDRNIKVVETLGSSEPLRTFIFDQPPRTNEQIEQIYEFYLKTGIFELVRRLNNLKDYLTGVEVGMDTHARKNRSGIAMELAVLPLVQAIVDANPALLFLFQKQFKEIENAWSLPVPNSLRERKFDYLVKKNTTVINIEVNFYAGGGSKPQEIVDSYINRQNELHEGQWEFIWITDGYGWKTARNQIMRAFNEVGYILNLEFAKKGLLKHIIQIL